MKSVSKLICAVALTMPLLASAATITATNTTNEYIQLCLGSVSSCPTVYPHQVFVITESFFNGACGSAKTCVLTADEYHLLPAPHQIKIATLTYNSHDGVIGMDKNPESKIDVTPNRFDITFQTKS